MPPVDHESFLGKLIGAIIAILSLAAAPVVWLAAQVMHLLGGRK
jgi:hypothetical protein